MFCHQRDSYRLRVRASDRGMPVLSADVDVELDVVDRNNKPPVWDENVYGPIHIKENVTVGTVVTSVKARFVCHDMTETRHVTCRAVPCSAVPPVFLFLSLTPLFCLSHFSLLPYSITHVFCLSFRPFMHLDLLSDIPLGCLILPQFYSVSCHNIRSLFHSFSCIICIISLSLSLDTPGTRYIISFSLSYGSTYG